MSDRRTPIPIFSIHAAGRCERCKRQGVFCVRTTAWGAYLTRMKLCMACLESSLRELLGNPRRQDS